jgi:hypothetical protein
MAEPNKILPGDHNPFTFRPSLDGVLDTSVDDLEDACNYT